MFILDTSFCVAWLRSRARAGRRIEPQDAMIAATAILCRATVVTGNLSHFLRVAALPGFSSLGIVDWEADPPDWTRLEKDRKRTAFPSISIPRPTARLR